MFSAVLRDFSRFGDRYAITLFKVAQSAKQVSEVSGDLKYMEELHAASPDFKVLLADPTIHKGKMLEILADLGSKGQFCETTNKMLKLMADNKRLNYLTEVFKTYEMHVRSLEKKEVVRVVSAEGLSEEEKKQVEAALVEMDKSKKYELTFAVEPSIMGGLQLYFPTAFMELSLKSRYSKIRDEVAMLGV